MRNPIMQEPPIQVQNFSILHGRLSYVRVPQVSLTVVVRHRNVDSHFILILFWEVGGLLMSCEYKLLLFQGCC